MTAGIASTPEESPHTSVKTRVAHVQQQGRKKDLAAALRGSVAGSQASSRLEESLWLIPSEDRRRLDSQREGMVEGFTLGNYLMLVEYTGVAGVPKTQIDDNNSIAVISATRTPSIRTGTFSSAL